jgi:hypothetical protein
MATTSHIISSERKLLALKGDFTESVKLTIPGEDRPPFLSGWYVFERLPDNNLFVRKRQGQEFIETISCRTKYLQFDRNMGILPNSHYYNYSPMGLRSGAEYELTKKRLQKLEEWRE